jgi:mono/diheme cytochrome c family protein
LNPPPRNFTQVSGWKFGRKPSQIFNTLKTGSPGTSMASFSTLPAEDRWALAHYVGTLGGEVLKDEASDWVKVGVDPTKDTMDGNSAQASIPVAMAMEKLEVKTPGVSNVPHFQIDQGALGVKDARPVAKLYATHCASCHGMRGEGAVVRSLGASPKSFIRTKSLASSDSDFKKVVIDGLPGDLMPGFGQFSGTQISELQGYVRSLTIR